MYDTVTAWRSANNTSLIRLKKTFQCSVKLLSDTNNYDYYCKINFILNINEACVNFMVGKIYRMMFSKNHDNSVDKVSINQVYYNHFTRQRYNLRFIRPQVI